MIMPSGVSEGLEVAAVTAVFVVLWYFVRRVLDEQVQMNKTLTTISDRIGGVIERVGKLEVQVFMRDKTDDIRHKDNVDAIKSTRSELNQLREKIVHNQRGA